MPKVFVTPRPNVLWYVTWDGTNFDELVSYFPEEFGPYFSVDVETQDLVYSGNHFPLGSNMTLMGGITNFPDNTSLMYQEVTASDPSQLTFVLDTSEES